MKKVYIGLDVHFKHSYFVAQDEEGAVLAQGNVATSRDGFEKIKKQTQAPEGTKAALETGSSSMFAVTLLLDLGYHPVVIRCPRG